MGAELVAEHWSAVRRWWLPDGLHGRFESLGLPADFWQVCGMLGVTEDNRLVIPIYGEPVFPNAELGSDPQAHADHLIDLCFFVPARPDKWWLRRNRGVLLGSLALALAADADVGLTVYRNPLRWLQHGGHGVCVLDWNFAGELLFGHDPFYVDDPQIAERLKTVFQPQVFVPADVAA